MDILEKWKHETTLEGKKILYTKEDKQDNIFVAIYKGIIGFFTSSEHKKVDMEETSKQVYMLDVVAKYSRYAQNPLVKMETFLQPICAYFIVPIFAFFNAGIMIDSSMDFHIDGILSGTIIGLVIGKPLGIVIFTFLGEKLNIAIRPEGLSYKHIFAVGVISGIGFTMSIFVANLAYGSEEQVVLAKLSILIASSIAAFFGVIALLFATKK